MSPASASDGTRHIVTIETAERRLDLALSRRLPLSRTRVQALIEAGRVTVDGEIEERSSAEVEAGAEIVVDVPPKQPPSFEPEAIPLTFLYEDDDCLVVDKPPGLVVHPAPGHPDGTLVNALLHHRPDVAGVGGERKAGLVHRLDKDTSGCLLVAKHDVAHASLSGQFAERTVEKRYWCFSWGNMGTDSGTLDRAIGRSEGDRKKMSSRTRHGRSAVTRWSVIERYAIADWLELTLITGRTHQIRVHLSEAGHPVVGDGRYGGGPARARGYQGEARRIARRAAALASRQALHARTLSFDRPADGTRVSVESSLPGDMVDLRQWLRRERTG